MSTSAADPDALLAELRRGLPEGLTARPLEPGDAEAVYEVVAAQEKAFLGTVEIEPADIVADWQRPSFDVPASTVGIFDGDRLVGYAEHTDHERGDAAVHPDRLGEGLGTLLAHWMQGLARSRGRTMVGMPTPEGSPGDRLLDSLGYVVRWTSWVLRLPEGGRVPDRPLPPGYTVGQAREDQWREAHDVREDAFLEWSDRDREAFEDFEAQTRHRPGWEPWMLRVVTDPEDRVAAVAVVHLASQDEEAFIDSLATRADQRHRGLAQALLVDAFAAGREHGAHSFCLSTDTRTGALGLYEKVGMRVTDTWVHRAARL